MEQIAGFTCDRKPVTPELSLWLRRGESLDWTVVREVIEHDGYRAKDYDMRGWTVIDCGAHIGVFSAWCASRGAAKVLAVEPQPQNRAVLLRNVADWPAVQVVGFALGDTPGETRIVWVSGGAHTVAPGEHNAMQPVWPVEQITLDFLLECYGVDHVDLLKLDMEGAEIPVLLSCSHDTLCRIDRIAAETHGCKTHPWCLADPAKLIDFLAPYFHVAFVGNPEGYSKLYATRRER